jgi:L-fuconolactonase
LTSLPNNIVDSHLSLFDRDGVKHDPADLGLLLAERGVSQGVLLQANLSLDDSLWTLEQADSSGFAGGAAVWVDLASPGAIDEMGNMSANQMFRGLCLPVWREIDNYWLLREDVLGVLREVASRGLSVDLQVAPRQLPSVGRLAEMVPDLRIALDHLGSPFISKSEREPWGIYMLKLAPHRNITVKVSGLITLDVQPGWNVAHLRLFVESAVRLFGFDRMMFGSDWPTHLQAATYEEVLAAAVGAAGPMTGAQQDQLLGLTACEFYRLG